MDNGKYTLMGTNAIIEGTADPDFRLGDFQYNAKQCRKFQFPTRLIFTSSVTMIKTTYIGNMYLHMEILNLLYLKQCCIHATNMYRKITDFYIMCHFDKDHLCRKYAFAYGNNEFIVS